ncbi:MAG TPA: hypothetical protein VNJ04_05165 [Gemmatimonadaceae bacterium]|nr:hypothetical protein [Gemmatimonadaceae bacterium]
MSDETKTTAEEAIAAIEKKRGERKAKIAEARAAQYAIDLAALNDLEVEHGDGSIVALEVGGFIEGLPTLVVIKSPGGTSAYTRYKSDVRKAGKNAEMIGAAQEQLGRSVIVYPSEDETKRAMTKAFPGLDISAGVRAVKFVELEAADEKKG